MTEEILRIGVWELKTIRVQSEEQEAIKEYTVDRLASGFVPSSDGEALSQLAGAIQYLSRKDTKSEVEFSIVVRRQPDSDSRVQ